MNLPAMLERLHSPRPLPEDLDLVRAVNRGNDHALRHDNTDRWPEWAIIDLKHVIRYRIAISGGNPERPEAPSRRPD
jgi:hypothetical protein